MIRITGTVEYADGTLVDFKAGSTALVAWEAYARRHGFKPYEDGEVTDPNTMAHVIAHTVLDVQEGFDVWRARVFDVDTQPVERVPPTLPAPSVA